MKYIILLLLLSVSCSVIPDIEYIYMEEWENLTVKESVLWVHDNIEYKTDSINWGPFQWQTARETLELKTGDCEDFVILTQAVLLMNGVESELIALYNHPIFGNHALLKVGEYCYDPTNPLIGDMFIKYSSEFINTSP